MMVAGVRTAEPIPQTEMSVGVLENGPARDSFLAGVLNSESKTPPGSAGSTMEKGPRFEAESDEHAFISLLKENEAKGSETREDSSHEDGNSVSWLVHFTELIQRIRETHGVVKSLTHLAREKPGDSKLGEYVERTITEDLDRADTALSSFHEYLKINSPIPRRDTVHLILEEMLKNNGARLREKRIKTFKKQYQKDLPEIAAHDEPLRYLLSTVFQYAISLIPPNGSIGFLTKSIEPKGTGEKDQTAPKKDARYVEILFGFSCQPEKDRPWEKAVRTPVVNRDETNGFLLKLVEGTLRKNRGTMRLKVDEGKNIMLISLILPVERRRIVSYGAPEL